jgi:hypothetical protein
MKKFTLFFMFFSFLATTYASNEKLYVLRSGSFWEENPVNIDPSNPCTEFAFKVTYTIPSPYTAVQQFDWYVNGVFVKTTTTVSLDANNVAYGGTSMRVTAPTTKVVCKVIYKNGSSVSAPFASNEYALDALLNPYSMSGPQIVEIGSQTVTYSLNKTGSGNWYYNLPLGSMSLAWEAPAGWTLTGTNGLTATFTTDNYSGGTVKAIFTVTGCGYQESPITWNVTRNYPPVSIITPNPGYVCYYNPTATYSINPQPAAVSYTYTIYPSYGSDISGVTFAANGQQTYTTTATSATINYNSSDNRFINLGVKANYGNGVSSPESTIYLIYWATLEWPTPADINITYTPISTGPCYGALAVEAPWVSGAVYYYYLDGWMVDQGSSNTTSFEYHGESVLSVYAWTNCANTGYLYKDLNGLCGWGARASDVNVSVYPNPAISEVTLTIKDVATGKTTTAAAAGKALKEIREVKMLDKFGSVKKIVKFPTGTKTTKLTLGTLPVDVYILEISDGVNKVIKRISKSR